MPNSDQGTEHYLSREDGQVYYRKVGEGAPLIFLHSVGLSGWSWRKVIGEFAEHFTCYNIDMPGYDHSDIPQRKYAIEDFTDAIVEVMDAEGIAQTSIVGDHTGSMVAVDLAARCSTRVKRMVLDGLPYWNQETGKVYFEKYFAPQHTDVTSYDVAVAPLISWEEAKALYPNLDHLHRNQEAWEKREEIKRKSRLWIRLCQDANTSYDVEVAASKVNTPTLLIYGEGDMARFNGNRAKDGIRGSLLREFSGIPAAAHEHVPEEFTKIALEFLLEG